MEAFVQENMKVRPRKLKEVIRLQQFLHDVEDEESWVHEKESISPNTECVSDEDSATDVLKKHDAFMSDLETYEAVAEHWHDHAKSSKQQYSPVFDDYDGHDIVWLLREATIDIV